MARNNVTVSESHTVQPGWVRGLRFWQDYPLEACLGTQPRIQAPDMQSGHQGHFSSRVMWTSEG
jgi:hypothetical protein